MSFKLGRLLMTRGISERISKDLGFSQFIVKSFERHCNGDWGELCEEDKELNELAVRNGDDRIFSRYDYGEDEEPIYIITEWDRSATTILFASEY